jgi:flagellar FliL protein
MNKILPILSVVSKVITTIAMVCIVIISLASAYIIFAPDEFPKPFHLSYIYPTLPAAASTAIAATPTPTPEPYKPGEGIMFNMSTKIINLADSTASKYIRLTMVLEFAPDDPTYRTMAADVQTAYVTTFTAKVNARMPLMDDTVITKLSTKAFEDLYTAAGKEKLREELVQAISARVPDLTLISVYFTEFVVQ